MRELTIITKFTSPLRKKLARLPVVPSTEWMRLLLRLKWCRLLLYPKRRSL